MDKKIKRLKLKGTEAWLKPDGYEIANSYGDGYGNWVKLGGAYTLPVDHYDIEYEEETPQPDESGFCNYDCPFAGSKDDYDPNDDDQPLYTLCSRHEVLMAWAVHYCPDAVQLKG